MNTATIPVQLPRSACSNIINLIGVVAFFCAVFYCRNAKIDVVYSTLITVGAYGAVILLLEVIFLRTPLRPSTGLDFSEFRFDVARVFYKLVGLNACYTFLAIVYWGCPVYSGGFFNDYYRAVAIVLPYLVLIAVPYVAFVDGFMKQPEDNYYWFGRLLLFKSRGTSWKALGQLLLGWIVKGYFLPLMFVFMVGDEKFLLSLDLTNKKMTFLNIYHPTITLFFLLDLLAATAGYMLTFRLLDTHIRSSEPTFLGWFVCLFCYDPFNDIYMTNYFGYAGGDDRWIQWLQDSPQLLMLWGSLIFLAIAVYSIAGLNFGIRFSNLTHRGVLTNGMYRFTKHPEYISKNMFWWMTFVPFISFVNNPISVIETARMCLLMGGVNLIYFLRARTEERHMSRDPVYVQYALWMNENGAFAWLGRLIPFFRYKAPVGWESFPVYMGIK